MDKMEDMHWCVLRFSDKVHEIDPELSSRKIDGYVFLMGTSIFLTKYSQNDLYL